MLNCVRLRRGETRNFTFGHATMVTRTITLSPGVGLVINRGKHTTFVKCGNQRIFIVRIVSLRRGQTLIVRCR